DEETISICDLNECSKMNHEWNITRISILEKIDSIFGLIGTPNGLVEFTITEPNKIDFKRIEKFPKKEVNEIAIHHSTNHVAVSSDSQIWLFKYPIPEEEEHLWVFGGQSSIEDPITALHFTDDSLWI